jgi:hypothetical protein
LQDILSNIIVLIVLAVLGGGVFLLVRREQAATQQELVQMALEHGWQLETVREPLAWGVRITGQAWILEAISRSSGADAAPGSSNVVMFTRWQADRPGSTLMLGPRLPGSQSAPVNFAHPFLRGLTGADMVEVPLDDTALQQKYMLWAQDPVGVRTWLTPAIVAALLAWKGVPPLVKRDQSGLQMEIVGERPKKPDAILAFIKIGEALLKPI